MKGFASIALCLVALGVCAAMYFIGLRSGQIHPAASGVKNSNIDPSVADQPDKVKRSSLDELILPAAVVKQMGLKTSVATVATHAIVLPNYQGVLALDNDHLSRVHARFGGEVVEIGKSTDGSDPTLRVGEHVQRGDLLAVVWSTALGEKKSELVDSLTKLRAEEQLRDRLKKLFESNAGAGRPYRDAEKDVEVRMVEIAGLERTLRTWRVAEEDFAEIRAEAQRVANADEVSETEMPAAEARGWAQVEVRAPMSGVILEKNVVVGDIVDTDADLFKIGDLTHLVVWVHVYEEDLPLLESLPHPLSWTVTLPSRPDMQFSGTLEKVGAVIDPSQHTALVTGRVDNRSGVLKIGQFVSVTIELPPSQSELELPSTAVVESGRQSVVFVQPATGEHRFVRRSVQVVRRFRDSIYVKIEDTGVQSGNLVVTSGALMLQNALDQLPAPLQTPSAAEINTSASLPGKDTAEISTSAP